MTLRTTQTLIEMSTRNISWGAKAAGALGRQPNHLHVPIVFKSGSLNLLELSRPVQACNGIAIFLIFIVATTMFRQIIRPSSGDFFDNKNLTVIKCVRITAQYSKI